MLGNASSRIIDRVLFLTVDHQEIFQVVLVDVFLSEHVILKQFLLTVYEDLRR